MMNTKFLTKSFLLSLAAAAALYGAPSKVELDEMTKIIGYFPEWGIYSAHNNYTPSKIAMEKVTHVNYAFATIEDGKIAYFDEYAAIDVTHGEAWDSIYKGNLGQLEKLKADYPHLSVLVSIGGWTQSGNFHDVASTQANREKFAASVVAFLRKHNLDGADIDWEYPTAFREADITDNANDQGTPDADSSEQQTFTLLLKTLREYLDTAGAEDNRYYQLSAAVSAGFEKIESTEPTLYPQYLDFINIMTYDMHGAWDSITNHQSALYVNPNAPDNLNIDAVITKFESYGINSKKLVIGTPFYSRGWKNVATDGIDINVPGLFASASGGADGIWDGGVAAGVNPYYALVEMENDSAFTKYYDVYAQAPVLYSASKQELYTYEDKQSLQAKVDYVKEKTLGGMIIWELSADTDADAQNNLLDVIYTGFYPDGITGYGEDNNTTSDDEEADESQEQNDGSSTNSTTTWSSATAYTVGSVVSYGTESYQAKWWTQGDTPGASEWGPWESLSQTSDETADDVVTEVEQSDETGDDVVTEVEDTTVDIAEPTTDDESTTTQSGSWSSSSIYTAGDLVSYGGENYKAKWWTQGDIPGANQWGPWESTTEEAVIEQSEDTGDNTSETEDSADTLGSTWSSSTVYTNGDVVLYNGIKYQAKWWTQGDAPGTSTWGPWSRVSDDTPLSD